MIVATLCFLLRNSPRKQICLGMKKRSLGKGKFNGFGGKLEGSESIEEATVRELEEESTVKTSIQSLTKVGKLTYVFPKSPEWNQIVHVFLTEEWEGEPVETEEMKPEWFDVDKMPLDKMWHNDRSWILKILNGKKVKGKIIHDEDTSAEIDIKEVSELGV